MSSAENICKVHLVQTIPRKSRYALLSVTTYQFHLNLDGLQYNTSTLLYLSLNIFIFVRLILSLSISAISPFIFKKTNSLSSHGYYSIISYSVLCEAVEVFFLLVIYLENVLQVSYSLISCHYLWLGTKQVPGTKS